MESVFSFLCLNVCTRFAREIVKNESEHFVDCRRKILSLADYRGAKCENFIRWAEPHVMYAKTCGVDRNGAVQDLEVKGPCPLSKSIGKQKLGTKTNERRLIFLFTMKRRNLQRN